MSLSPPRKPEIGQVWVDPFTAERYVYEGGNKPYIAPSGLHLDAYDGWVKWDLRNEQHKYERDEKASA